MLNNGSIAPSDLAWHEGLSAWQPLHTIAGVEKANLAPLTSPVPPPLPLSPLSGDTGSPGPKRGRNLFLLILMALVWTLVIWIGSLFLSGMIAGVLNPQNAEQAGAAIGEKLGGPLLLVAMLISIGLTIAGKLPGTGRRSS